MVGSHPRRIAEIDERQPSMARLLHVGAAEAATTYSACLRARVALRAYTRRALPLPRLLPLLLAPVSASSSVFRRCRAASHSRPAPATAVAAMAGLRRTTPTAARPPVFSAASAAPGSTHLLARSGTAPLRPSPSWWAARIARSGRVASIWFMAAFRAVRLALTVGIGASTRRVGAHSNARSIHVPRGLARCVAVALHGSSGQGCFG